MASVALVHPQETRKVSRRSLLTNCTLFGSNPPLCSTPYVVKTSVSLDIFQQFVSALEDKPIEITPDSISGLSRLAEEFGFGTLSRKLNSNVASAPRGEDFRTRERITGIEERQLSLESRVASLNRQFSQLSATILRL
jgi:hypothetical protein